MELNKAQEDYRRKQPGKRPFKGPQTLDRKLS